MGTMWNSLKRGLQDGAAVVFDKAEGLTQVGRARLDVAAAKTKLSRLEGQLGVETYGLVEAGAAGPLAESERVQSLCAAIREASAELSDAEAVFEKVRKDLQSRDAEHAEEETPLGT